MLDFRAKRALARIRGLNYALSVKANHFELNPDKNLKKLLHDINSILRQLEAERTQLAIFLQESGN